MFCCGVRAVVDHHDRVETKITLSLNNAGRLDLQDRQIRRHSRLNDNSRRIVGGVESNSSAITVAELVISPPSVGRRTTMTVALLPLGNSATLQVRMPLSLVHVPRSDVAETKGTLVGKVSVKMTPVAILGP
jgi:hypothetical protein